MAAREGGTPGVSVIVPTYERRELVREAIESVRAQTYRDFELIVIDDGSTDGTSELLESLGRREPRLRHRRQENRGVAAARNAGIGLSRAPVVAFLDSDNLWLEDHLAVLNGILARFPEAVLATTSPGYRLSGRASPDRARLVRWGCSTLDASSTGGFMSGLAVRRDALRAAGAFDVRMGVGEDSDLFPRLALTGPFATLRRRTFIRRVCEGSLKATGAASGEYLRASAIRAENLASFARRLPPDRRDRVLSEADGLAAMARAFQALARGDRRALEAELRSASPLLSLSEHPRWVDDKLRHHHPRGGEALELLRARRLLADAWPDPADPAALYLRLLAIGSALRLGRLRGALTLAAGWPRRLATVRSLPKLLAALRKHLMRVRLDRRCRLGAGG